MNTLLWIATLVVCFALTMASFRLWGKTGLLVWMAVSCIVANIQVTKNVTLFGLESTLGNIVYSCTFLATDIISEAYGRKEAQKAVWTSFFALLSMTALMQLALLFTPSATDLVQDSLEKVFTLMPRIAGGSVLAYLASNFHDIWAFDFWKRKTGGKHLWIRNNASTLVSQALDTAVFTLAVFAGVYELQVLLEIMLSTYILKALTALADTPMAYLARKWAKSGLVSDITA